MMMAHMKKLMASAMAQPDSTQPSSVLVMVGTAAVAPLLLVSGALPWLGWG